MKTFVRIISLGATGETVAEIKTFNSEQEFLFYWQTPANFGFGEDETPSFQFLTPEEIQAYLKPFQDEIIATEILKFQYLKPLLERHKKAVAALVERTGVDYKFQDENGVVYKTTQPEGTFVFYQKFGVDRTRFEGEAKGTLSLTEARAAGFVVEGK